MNNWDDLRFLVALSKTGTMTAAAKILGTNTATVSRRIDRLSETLGKPAFVKTGDGWRPSDAVSSLIQLAQHFDGQLQATLNSQAVDNATEPVTINIGSLPVVTAAILFPGLTRHHKMLEGVRLTFSDRMFKEGLGENDLVIQTTRPDQGRIVTRKIGRVAKEAFVVNAHIWRDRPVHEVVAETQANLGRYEAGLHPNRLVVAEGEVDLRRRRQDPTVRDQQFIIDV